MPSVRAPVPGPLGYQAFHGLGTTGGGDGTAQVTLALAIIDCLVVEAERFHANTDDLEALAIQKFKGKCKDPIRKEGSKLWTNVVTAMRDAGIGEVTKSKPLTFRRFTDADGHRRMSA